MAEDRPEDSDPSPDSARPKRAPPTIDLEATDVSSEPPPATTAAAAHEAAAEQEPKSGPEPKIGRAHV